MTPGGSLGAHDTPPGLADELVRRLLALGPVGRVLDPACGHGELLLAALRAGLPADRLSGIELDPGRAEVARARLRASGGAAAARNLVTGDSLEGPWPRETGVLANPPWVSFSGRRSRGGSRRQEGHRGWPSLHGAFLERIAQHVDAESRGAAILVPRSVCEQEGYGTVRAAVRAHARLVGAPTVLPEDTFRGVIGPAALVVLAPGASDGGDTPWSARPEGMDAELLTWLEAFPRLPARCFADPGVHTGNSARELLLPAAGAPEHARVREGRDLEAFRLGPPRRALDLALERTDGRRFRIAPLERYRAVPLLIRQTANRPIAALHTQPGYFRNTLLACTPPAELDPAFCQAVLNGSLAAAWHRLTFADARQRAFPQVKVGHLRTLPFPIGARAESRHAHDEIAARARALSTGREEPGSAAFDAEVRALDAFVGELYFAQVRPKKPVRSVLRSSASSCQISSAVSMFTHLSTN